MATRGRTNGDGSVTFYDDVTGAAVLALDDAGDAGLMEGSAPVVNNSAAADVATLVADYNALLAALRTRGVIAGS